MRLFKTCLLLCSFSMPPVLAQNWDMDQITSVPGFQILAPLGKVTPLPVAPTDWLRSAYTRRQAEAALELLENAQNQGLVPEYYQARALREQMQLVQKSALTGDQLNQFNRQFNAQVLQYVLDVKNGQIDPKQVKQNFNRLTWSRLDAQNFINYAVSSGRVESQFNGLMDKVFMYPELLQALQHYRQLIGHPAWQSDLTRTASPGQSYSQLETLVARLQALGDLSTSATIASNYSGDVVQAVRDFQLRHGFKGDGKIDTATLKALNISPAQRVKQITLNLERLRWTPWTGSPRMVVVNIPEFILRAYSVKQHQIEPQLEMRVIVGKSFDTDTPLFDGNISAIEFSPYWNVPISIARKETIPKIQANPGYLAASGMEFVSASGVSTEVSEANIAAVLSGSARLRQRPGSANALGDIKFIFPNSQNIYLHHTPSTRLFNRTRRDLSHGCIRVEEPVQLAEFVLAKQTEWTKDRIKKAMDSKKSSTIRVLDPVHVVLAYSTVVVKQDKVYFLNDIYGQDGILAKALSRRK